MSPCFRYNNVNNLQHNAQQQNHPINNIVYPSIKARNPKTTVRNENNPNDVKNKMMIKPIHPKVFVSISKIVNHISVPH